MCAVAHERVDAWRFLRRAFAQYFEANCGYGSRPYIYMRPALDNTTAPVIKLNYDIVLNGNPRTNILESWALRCSDDLRSVRADRRAVIPRRQQ